MPEADPLPAPRSIADIFPADRDKLTVYLSIAARKANGMNYTLNETAGNGTRFTAQTRKVLDEVNGLDEKPLRVGIKNITLALETELNPQAVTLPIARLIRSGAGRFELDPTFIPPSLEITASPRLMSLTERLIEILEEKSSMLARSHADCGRQSRVCNR